MNVALLISLTISSLAIAFSNWIWLEVKTGNRFDKYILPPVWFPAWVYATVLSSESAVAMNTICLKDIAYTRMPFYRLINFMEDIFLQSFLSSIKQFLGKLPVRGIGNRGREKFLRRLVKRPFDGKEDRLHQMLLLPERWNAHSGWTGYTISTGLPLLSPDIPLFAGIYQWLCNILLPIGLGRWKSLSRFLLNVPE